MYISFIINQFDFRVFCAQNSERKRETSHMYRFPYRSFTVSLLVLSLLVLSLFQFFYSYHQQIKCVSRLVSSAQAGISYLANFIPVANVELPSESKTSWWIPSAVKVIALLNAANNLAVLPVVDYKEFYNQAIDHTG